MAPKNGNYIFSEASTSWLIGICKKNYKERHFCALLRGCLKIKFLHFPGVLDCLLCGVPYIWLDSALHSIFQLWMSRYQGQRLCSHSLNFDLLSKSFGIYLNHITASSQNFGKSSTHQKSPFLEVSILGNGLSVRSNPHIHKNSNISKIYEGMFMKM